MRFGLPASEPGVNARAYDRLRRIRTMNGPQKQLCLQGANVPSQPDELRGTIEA